MRWWGALRAPSHPVSRSPCPAAAGVRLLCWPRAGGEHGAHCPAATRQLTASQPACPPPTISTSKSTAATPSTPSPPTAPALAPAPPGTRAGPTVVVSNRLGSRAMPSERAAGHGNRAARAVSRRVAVAITKKGISTVSHGATLPVTGTYTGTHAVRVCHVEQPCQSLLVVWEAAAASDWLRRGNPRWKPP